MARVNEVVREALGDELERLSDPRLGIVTITGVDVSADLRQATVYYSALGRTGKKGRGPWIEVRGLEAPPSGPAIDLYRDGERLETGGLSGSRTDLERPGSYRVVGSRAGEDGLKLPWILSNPVRVGE